MLGRRVKREVCSDGTFVGTNVIICCCCCWMGASSSSSLGLMVGNDDVELATAAVDVPDMVSDPVGRAVKEAVFPSTSTSLSVDNSNGSFSESTFILLFSSSTRSMNDMDSEVLPPTLPLLSLAFMLLVLLNGLMLPVELYDTPTATMANTKTPKMNAVEKTVTHLDRRLE